MIILSEHPMVGKDVDWIHFEPKINLIFLRKQHCNNVYTNVLHFLTNNGELLIYVYSTIAMYCWTLV
jgi:hypothetical protein